MAKITGVHEDSVDGNDGFIVNWQFIGLSKASAKFRAVGMTAMRFPTTITEAEAVDVEKFSDGYRVAVFVPTEGLLSAGVGNPVKWMIDNFGERFGGR